MPKTTAPSAEPFLLGWLPHGRDASGSLTERGPHEIAPCVVGLLALARRRRVTRALVQASAEGGSATFGVESRVRLDAAAARLVIISLREAARLPRSAPHVVGSFTASFGRVGVEARHCHDGEKAIVDLPGETSRAPDVPRDALFQEVLLSYVSGLDTVHGSALAPEVLLSIRFSAEAADLTDLAWRHLDLTLLAATRQSPCAPPLASLLGRTLGRLLLTGQGVEDAIEMLHECRRLARRVQDTSAGELARDVVARALQDAPPGLQRALRAAFELT